MVWVACSSSSPPASDLNSTIPPAAQSGANNSAPPASGSDDASTGGASRDSSAGDQGDTGAEGDAGTADGGSSADSPSVDDSGRPAMIEGGADGPSSDAARADAHTVDANTGDGPGAVETDAGSRGPLCTADPSHVWTPIHRVPSQSQTGFARFGGVGIDELTIAWTSASGAVYVADRATRAASFGAPSVIDTTSVPVAADRVALASNGMEVVAVSSTRNTLVSFNRANVASTWTAASTLPFANIDAQASEDQSGQLSEPVLGGDGNTLFFVLAISGAVPALYETKWDAQTGAWSTGAVLPNPQFLSTDATGTAASTTFATGLSSDGLTLFFHSAATGQERAAWRSTTASAFTQFVDVVGFADAVPNFLCNTLYFAGTDADSGTPAAFVAQ